MPMRRIFERLRGEPDFPLGRLAFMAALSGLAGGALLPTIALASGRIAAGQVDLQLFFLALVLAVLSGYAQHDARKEMAQDCEEALLKLRLRIAERSRRADLRWIEETGTPALYTALAQDTQWIAQAAPLLILMVRSALAVLLALAWLGWVSLIGLLVALAFIGVFAFIQAAFVYPGLARKLEDSRLQEWGFYGSLQGLLGGFKESALNRRRSEDVFHRYAKAAANASAAKRAVGTELADAASIGYSAIYLLLIALAVAIPGLDGHAFHLAVAALFLVSELNPWPTWMAQLAPAVAALEALFRLEEKLSQAPHAQAPTHAPEPLSPFTRLCLEGVAFSYEEAEGPSPFLLGPLDLAVNRGELLFIAGAVGSGKTTLLKLLAGLYRPQAGVFKIDGTALDLSEQAGYREFFAAVFADFHLPDRCYGPHEADPARVRDWLEVMGLGGKASFAEGGFSHRYLSPGQSKRLAFIAAVLEGKPVLLLDDFAGNQDEAFRDRFHREILQDIKRQGTTVVAVVNDERYFGLADRVVELSDGQWVAAP